MAIITLQIEDCEQGVRAKFLSDEPLPENPEEYTDAQKFVVELHRQLESINIPQEIMQPEIDEIS